MKSKNKSSNKLRLSNIQTKKIIHKKTCSLKLNQIQDKYIKKCHLKFGQILDGNNIRINSREDNKNIIKTRNKNINQRNKNFNLSNEGKKSCYIKVKKNNILERKKLNGNKNEGKNNKKYKLKIKFPKKQINGRKNYQKEQNFLEKIQFIQIWWKTIFQVIKLQKIIRGFLFRKKLIEKLNIEEIIADNILFLIKAYKRIFFNFFLNKLQVNKFPNIRYYFKKWYQKILKRIIINKIVTTFYKNQIKLGRINKNQIKNLLTEPNKSNNLLNEIDISNMKSNSKRLNDTKNKNKIEKNTNNITSNLKSSSAKFCQSDITFYRNSTNIKNDYNQYMKNGIKTSHLYNNEYLNKLTDKIFYKEKNTHKNKIKPQISCKIEKYPKEIVPYSGGKNVDKIKFNSLTDSIYSVNRNFKVYENHLNEFKASNKNRLTKNKKKIKSKSKKNSTKRFNTKSKNNNNDNKLKKHFRLWYHKIYIILVINKLRSLSKFKIILSSIRKKNFKLFIQKTNLLNNKHISKLKNSLYIFRIKLIKKAIEKCYLYKIFIRYKDIIYKRIILEKLKENNNNICIEKEKDIKNLNNKNNKNTPNQIIENNKNIFIKPHIINEYKVNSFESKTYINRNQIMKQYSQGIDMITEINQLTMVINLIEKKRINYNIKLINYYFTKWKNITKYNSIYNGAYTYKNVSPKDEYYELYLNANNRNNKNIINKSKKKYINTFDNKTINRNEIIKLIDKFKINTIVANKEGDNNIKNDNYMTFTNCDTLEYNMNNLNNINTEETYKYSKVNQPMKAKIHEYKHLQNIYYKKSINSSSKSKNNINNISRTNKKIENFQYANDSINTTVDNNCCNFLGILNNVTLVKETIKHDNENDNTHKRYIGIKNKGNKIEEKTVCLYPNKKKKILNRRNNHNYNEDTTIISEFKKYYNKFVQTFTNSEQKKKFNSFIINIFNNTILVNDNSENKSRRSNSK